ncbi:MAG: type II toxin-antitoxin system RelE/ParE family toxin [Acidimicrobiales bacterium]
MASFPVSPWSIEWEPEEQGWSDGLSPAGFATVAFHIDRLAERGSTLRMPYSRSLGDGPFELRLDLGRLAQRVAFIFPRDRRIVL